jgi:hypothetical protein
MEEHAMSILNPLTGQWKNVSNQTTRKGFGRNLKSYSEIAI